MLALEAGPARIASLASALGVLLAATSAAAQAPGGSTAKDGAGPEAEIAHVTAAVVLDGEALFRVRGTTTYPAEERAGRIAARIEEAARTPSIAPETVLATPAEELVNITAGDRFLVSVTDADARLEGLERGLLARVYVERIQAGIRAYRQARDPQVLLRATRRAVGASVLLLAALLLLVWAFRRLDSRFAQRYEERIRSVHIQSFEILRATPGASSDGRGSCAMTGAVLVDLGLQFVLGSFPATRPLAARLLGLVLEPVSSLGAGLVSQLPALGFLLVLYLVTRWLLGLTRLFFDAVGKGHVTLSGFEPEWAVPTYRIVRMAIVAFALVVAYPYIPGPARLPSRASRSSWGSCSIGSSSFISNIAGYSMTYRRAFRVGDRIRRDVRRRERGPPPGHPRPSARTRRSWF
jgi:hypothetical protein